MDELRYIRPILLICGILAGVQAYLLTHKAIPDGLIDDLRLIVSLMPKNQPCSRMITVLTPATVGNGPEIPGIGHVAATAVCAARWRGE